MEIPGITDRMKVEAGRVEVRGGGGCLSAVGILFLLAGCGGMAAFAFGDSLAADNTWVFAVVGLMCIVPGVVLAFGRYTLLIDGNTRTYRKRFSVLVTIKNTGGSLDEFDKLVITRRMQRRDGKTYTDYAIRLEGSGNVLEIASPDLMKNARRDAEQVAKALHLPLADRIESTETVRDADHLDESLRERRRRTGEGPDELPAPPEGIRTRVRIEGREVVLEIPPAGCTSEALGHLISWAILAPGLGLVLFRPFRELAGGAGSAEPIVVLFFIFLSICAGISLFLRSLRRSYTVRVSPERLHLTTRGVLFTSSSDIPADELEELRIAEPRGGKESADEALIVARSDRTTIQFGHNLPPEEKEWVKTALEHVLTT